MKKLILIVTIILPVLSGYAQIFEPVEWHAAVQQEDTLTYLLTYKATIEEGWHVYSQTKYPQDILAPLPLAFNYQNEGVELVGPAIESETRTSYNEFFKLNETYFEKEATLTQRVKLLDDGLEKIKVEIEYQVCKDVCINETSYFLFDLRSQVASVVDAQQFKDASNEINAQGLHQADPEQMSSTTVSDIEGNAVLGNTLLSMYIIAFLSGIAALLTPCVFPLIPMTVSFFTKQSTNRTAGVRNAMLYGLFIIVIYVGLGSFVTAIFGADALNTLSTNVWFNLLFFIILVVFGLSFLGAFEIVLPHSWANKLDRQADRGGMIGIFFMALVLAIVSFSCTGPIVGTILVEAATKGGITPIIGMLGFSTAIALPFTLFAIFPGWLNSLPKSGSWLNTVKVFLGFIELAFALKFLSNADLVLQLGLLRRELFLATWVIIFGALGLFLLGKLRFSHSTAPDSISVGRMSLALVVLSFTLYLVPGLWGAPLKLISGFPPPITYSESPGGFGRPLPASSEEKLPEGAKFGEHGIISFTDYKLGLEYAKKVNKPVLIDFTGYACVNCRKMEENVWSQPKVLNVLKNDVVLISLYVDYKKSLSEEEQYVSEVTGKRIRTIGNKWSDFQITRYKANAQPYYVMTNLDESSLSAPIGYTSDADEYLSWLKKGVENFED